MSESYGDSLRGGFGFHRQGRPVSEVIQAVARRLWPTKTAQNLSSRAGTTHRAAERWLADEATMNADALAELLRSDAGLHVLEELMGATRPSWWPAFKVSADLDAIEREQAALTARIEGLRRGR